MQKPVIFFSHSSKDKRALTQLKELFVEKTGNTIEVFLSSDGQSIQLGRNWVHRVEEAMDLTKLMMVFISPNSHNSGWIYFESGYAYSKGIRVIPIGFSGVDIGSIKPPLNLLQGFNISSEDGLNNLIAISNDTFKYNHKLSFSKDDFLNVMGNNNLSSNQTFGDYVNIINNVRIHLSEGREFDLKASDALQIISDLLKKENVEHQEKSAIISLFGMTITTQGGIHPAPIEFALDPFLIDHTFPLAEKCIRAIRKDGISKLGIRIDFMPEINCVQEFYKLSGRFFGSQAKLCDDNSIQWKDIIFNINHLISLGGPNRISRGAAYLFIKPVTDGLPISQINELVEILFERKLLYFSADVINN